MQNRTGKSFASVIQKAHKGIQMPCIHAVRYKKEAGITLVEVVISASLIVLVGGAILGLIVQNMKIGATLDYNYAAINIAKSRIDRIRELRRDKGFGQISTAGESGVTVNRDGLPDSDGIFTRATSISTGFGGNNNLTKIEVSVSYKAPGDIATSTVTFTTLLSPYI